MNLAFIDRKAKFTQTICDSSVIGTKIMVKDLHSHIIPIHRLVTWKIISATQTLQFCRNERDGISNHRRPDYLFNRLFRRRLKKTSKPCVTSLCEGNSPVTDEFPHKGPVARKMFLFDNVIMTPYGNSHTTGPLTFRSWNNVSLNLTRSTNGFLAYLTFTRRNGLPSNSCL